MGDKRYILFYVGYEKKEFIRDLLLGKCTKVLSQPLGRSILWRDSFICCFCVGLWNMILIYFRINVKALYL